MSSPVHDLNNLAPAKGLILEIMPLTFQKHFLYKKPSDRSNRGYIKHNLTVEVHKNMKLLILPEKKVHTDITPVTGFIYSPWIHETQTDITSNEARRIKTD